MTVSRLALIDDLRGARRQRGISQRALGEKVDLPQSHISRIESGAIDVQASTLFELARALDLELVLVPRQLLPAVTELKRRLETEPASGQVPAYRLSDEDDGN